MAGVPAAAYPGAPAAGVPVGVPVAAAVQDPIAALNALPAVFIKQQISLTEVLTGCEMKNKYRVYAADPATMDKIEGRDALFRMQEDSTCFQRQCCGPHREFNMDMFMRDPYNPEEGKGPILTRTFRPFKCCEFLCFNRPEMFVKDKDNSQIGHVINPFTCCSLDVNVEPPVTNRSDIGPVADYAGKGEVTGWPWKITASCCQLGLFCQCPCEPCKRVVFHILDSAGAVVGELQHVFAGCCKEAIDVDNYAIRFPVGATWWQKATLINTAILIDFLYFEKKQKNNGAGGS